MPQANTARLSPVRALMLRLRGRPDSEHEMSFNRLIFALVALSYVVIAGLDPAAIPVLILFCMFSLAVFVRILFGKPANPRRLLSVMVVDMATIAYFMHTNADYTAGFWPLFLWTTLGNGFRFGIPYLFAATATTIVCFGLVIAITPYWQENLALAIGLLIGLVMLPAYASRLIRKLSKAKAEAEEASRAKSYFLASVSHELRTPLTAIIGLGAHLRDSDLPAEQRNMAATVVTAGRSLLSLINQLLDFARLGAKGIVAEAKPFDLLPMLHSVRDLFQVAAEEKGLRIAVHVAAHTPLRIAGDESHIRDVLVNLVGNAIKFTDKGSVTISADAEWLAGGSLNLVLAVTDTGIGIEPEAQQHIFDSFRQADDTIIDRFGGTGLGLAISKQVATLLGGTIGVDSTPGQGSSFWFTAKVADASAHGPAATPLSGDLILCSSDEQAITAMRTAARNAGLSLVTRRDLREAGALVVDPAQDGPRPLLIDERELGRQAIEPDRMCEVLGSGTSAILLRAPDSTTPDGEIIRNFASSLTPASDVEELTRACRIASASAAERTGDETKEEEAPPTRALRILVADDNVMNQKVFSMILGRAGHSIEIAENGEAALDVMKDHGFDIVLMDVNMPVLNGIEATKLYRFTALGRKRIPIVGITADASPATAERCLEAGMDACVSKPIEAAPLLNVIATLIARDENPVVPAFDPSGVVVSLFRDGEPEDASPAINAAKLDELEELGGPEFVEDLLRQYLVDAESLLAEIRKSVAEDDVDGFRSGTHALRSSGANIGADKVAKLCLHYQRIDRAEFEAQGESHVASLEAELRRVRAWLDRPRPTPATVAQK